MTLRLVSPAPPSAGLALAGGRARVRRGVLWQLRNADSVAIYDGGELLAVAMFGPHGWRRIEMALAIGASAAPRMHRLVRLAQMTLARIGKTHLVVASVHPANAAGQRMARLVGFRPARCGPPGIWVFRGARQNGCDFRRRAERPAQGGRGQPQTAGGG
ncbi:MAG: hypothetical protein KIS96_14430 [Bauldia sp.]|nr:hypothetical protein [Bauldia sp.]